MSAVNAHAVRRRHEAALMSLQNVNGVAVVPEPGRGEVLVVYVSRKVPRNELDEGQIIPEQLEDVPVHVVEIGSVVAQAHPGAQADLPVTDNHQSSEEDHHDPA